MGEDGGIEAVLVHSPLVGPLTMAPLGAELTRRGWTAVTPDLRSVVESDDPSQDVVDLIIGASSHTELLVGHSGAGVFLPLIADRLDPEITVFVDAVVPGGGGAHRALPSFLELLDSLPHDDGRLPPWHEWWGPAAMSALVPDADQREQIAAETRRVPRRFYDDPTPIPSGWSAKRCAYLQLSPAYDDDRRRAESFGWPTSRLDGRHLDVAVRPVAVCDALLMLIERAPPHP